MKPILNLVGHFLKYQKKLLVALLFFVIFYAIILFPFDDLSDLMTTKVSEASNGSVYIQADSLGIHWLPTPGVKLSAVLLQIVNLPNITSDELTLTPSLISLLRGAVGANIVANGLFKGHIDLNYEEGEKNKEGTKNQRIKIEATDIALNVLSSFIRDLNVGDFKMIGAMNLSGQAKIDPSYEEQPSGNIDLSIKNFVFPSYVVYMSGAPMLSLPELKFKKSLIKSVLAEGKMQIDDLSLGDEKDDISCKLRGDIAMKMLKGKAAPDLGAYNFNVEIKVQQKFYDQNSVLFALLQSSFKKPVPGGQKFSFKISGDNFATNPRMTNF